MARSSSHNNSAYVRAIVREAERVNANRRTAGGAPAERIKVLPWVWYRYLRFGTTEKKSMLAPRDMHSALAGPGIAGADGVLFYEDGASWGPSPTQQAQRAVVQGYIDTVVGPTATALYHTPAFKTDELRRHEPLTRTSDRRLDVGGCADH
jgi:hypothetical protein